MSKLPPHIVDLSFWITDSDLVYSPRALTIRFYDENIEAHVELSLQDWGKVEEWVDKILTFPVLPRNLSRDAKEEWRTQQINDFIDVNMTAAQAYQLYLDLTKNETPQ